MNKRTLLIGLGILMPLIGAGCELAEDILQHRGGGGPGKPMGPQHGCTAIGCTDQLNVAIRPKGGVFAVGRHQVEIFAEGRPVETCTFEIPAGGGPERYESAECTGGVMLSVAPAQTCTTTMGNGVASQSCAPVPGRFEERLQIPGTPAKVRITQRAADGTPYLDESLAPGYAPVYPNGVACGAVCTQAKAEYEF